MLSFSSRSKSLSHREANTTRPTNVRASVGSRMSASSARPMRSVWAWAPRAAAKSTPPIRRAKRLGFIVDSPLVACSLSRGPEARDARVDLGAVDDAHRVGARRQACGERLEALEARGVEAAKLPQRLGMVVHAHGKQRIVL